MTLPVLELVALLDFEEVMRSLALWKWFVQGCWGSIQFCFCQTPKNVSCPRFHRHLGFLTG
jgi:hypothetical protein